MNTPYFADLSRRERQIIDVLYRLGESTVADALTLLPDDPSYDTVRITLGILEKKGYVAHRKEGSRYVYRPTIPIAEAKSSAVNHMMKTFFQGSMPQAVLALLGSSQTPITEHDLDEIEAWIAEERKKQNE